MRFWNGSPFHRVVALSKVCQMGCGCLDQTTTPIAIDVTGSIRLGRHPLRPFPEQTGANFLLPPTGFFGLSSVHGEPYDHRAGSTVRLP
jgi:hypothetical protein